MNKQNEQTIMTATRRFADSTGLALGCAPYREPFTHRPYVQLSGELGSHKLYSFNDWLEVRNSWY